MHTDTPAIGDARPAVVATFAAMFLNKRFGRHRTMLAGGLCFIVAAPLQAAAPARESGLGMVYVGRAMVGCGMALFNQAGPAYLAEAAPHRYRAAATMAIAIGTTVAIFVAVGGGQ